MEFVNNFDDGDTDDCNSGLEVAMGGGRRYFLGDAQSDHEIVSVLEFYLQAGVTSHRRAAMIDESHPRMLFSVDSITLIAGQLHGGGAVRERIRP